MTNADWIRRIGRFLADATVPQLADFLDNLALSETIFHEDGLAHLWCDGQGPCQSREEGMPLDGDCKGCIERYLLQEGYTA